MRSNSVYTKIKSGMFYLTFNHLKEPSSYQGKGDAYYNFGGVFLNDEEASSFKEGIDSTIMRGQHFFNLQSLKDVFDKKNGNLTISDYNNKWNKHVADNKESLLKSIGINPHILKHTGQSYKENEKSLSEKDKNFHDQWHFKCKNKSKFDLYVLTGLNEPLKKIYHSEAEDYFKLYSICIANFNMCLASAPGGSQYFGVYPTSLIKIKDSKDMIYEPKSSDLNEDEEFIQYLYSKL